MADKERARVAISMYRNDYEELSRIAEDRGKTLSQYLQTALAIQRYIDNAEKRGAHFLVENKSWRGTVQREIFFP